MPYLKIATNLPLDEETANRLATTASAATANMLSKPERYVMVDVRGGRTMSFAGSTDPLAYLELKSLGLGAAQCPALAAELCDLITTELSIPTDRVYIEFASPERTMWGWDRGTFG